MEAEHTSQSNNLHQNKLLYFILEVFNAPFKEVSVNRNVKAADCGFVGAEREIKLF